MRRSSLIFVFCISTALFGTDNTLQNVESMVKDIKQMREHYQKALNNEKRKNETLQRKLDMALEAVKSLRSQIKSEKKSQKTTLECVQAEENRFPKLKIQQQDNPKISFFKASPFRLKNNAKIYNDFENPKYVTTWEAGRSFTSNQKADGWIKITGYFVDRVWQAATEDLWVRESDVIKRESK